MPRKSQPLTVFPALVAPSDTCCSNGRLLTLCGALLLVLSLAFLTVGVGGPLFIDHEINVGLRGVSIIDSADAAGFWQWQNDTAPDSLPTYYEWYFYNVTNADEFLAGNASKLEIDEVGPYAYRQYTVNADPVFSNASNVVTWNNWEFYVLDANRTGSNFNPITDQLTVVNVPLIGVFNTIVNQRDDSNDEWWQMIVFDLVTTYTNASLFVRGLSPNASIFGYEDPTLKFLAGLQPSTPTMFQLQKNYSSPEASLADSQIYSTYTGADDYEKAGEYILFNNYSTMTCWATPEANTVSGSGPYQTARGTHIGSQRQFWLSPIYRALTLVTNMTVDLYGVTVNKFFLDKSSFANASEYPPNAAYYMFGPSGVANLTSTPMASNAPIYASNPRFVDADSSYWQHLSLRQCADVDNATAYQKGLCPDDSKHVSWAYIEPLSGLLFGARKLLQINVDLPDSVLLLYPSLKSLLVPLGWCAISGQATQALAQKFHDGVYPALLAKTLSRYIGLIGGGVLMLLSIVMLFVGVRRIIRYRGYSPLIVQ